MDDGDVSKAVNDVRVSFGRNYSFITQEPFGRNKPSDFIPGIPSDPLSDGAFPDRQSVGTPLSAHPTICLACRLRRRFSSGIHSCGNSLSTP